MGPTPVERVLGFERLEQGLGLGREGRLADGDRVGEGTGLADERRQVMPEVGGERALGDRPRVARDDRRPRPQLDPGGVRPQPQGGAGLADRDRVAAAVEGDESLRRGAHRVAGAGQERTDRERGEQRPLGGEALADRLGLTRPTAALLGGRPPDKILVEFVERGHLGDRHEVGPPGIADEAFHESLLMALARRAVMSPEAVCTLEGDELGRRVERAPPERAEPRWVVVPDLGRRPAPGRERPDVAIEPGRPVLGRIGHHDVAGRVGQAGAEQGDDRLDAGDPDACLAEVDLGLGTRVVGERDGDRAQAGPAVVADPRPHGRLATREAMFGDEALPDPARGVVLLVVDPLIAFEPALDDGGDGIHDRGRPSARPTVRPGSGIVEGPADRRPAVVEGAGELANARPFPEVGVPDTLDVDHLDQPFLQDGCGFNHRHRTGWLEGQGGPALADHSAPGWVHFTLSLAAGR